MELVVTNRQGKAKSEIKKIRREGNIPAILYSQGKVGVGLVVPGNEFKKILNKTVSGTMPTTIFHLKNGKSSLRAILKGIQYNIAYDVIHLDFVELIDNTPVELAVPVQCTGMTECAGVKLGGVFRQVLRHVKVRCLPKDIPAQFDLNVGDLALNEAKRVSDIALPPHLRLLLNPKDIVAVVTK